MFARVIATIAVVIFFIGGFVACNVVLNFGSLINSMELSQAVSLAILLLFSDIGVVCLFVYLLMKIWGIKSEDKEVK